MSKKLEVHKVTQKELASIAQERGSIRAGSTVDPNRRAGDYAREEGYRGKMYVAPTSNMMKAEDKLLQQNSYRHNDQQASNNREGPGYSYVIQGRRMN